MESKMVKRTQLELIKCCEDNLKINLKINAIKKMVIDSEESNILMEIHEEEMKVLVETYINNSIKVGENVVILGLDDFNHTLN
jgi:hypothetical protein